MFATLRLALIRLIQRIRHFSSRDISFYAAKADYALYVAVGPRIDTVGVWGSNPHAPTNALNNLAAQHSSVSLRPLDNFAVKWRTFRSSD